ncbi:hypothetical protein HPB50_027886 [Hyalomma asiaticum]|nr:hypothetical protein HPB50_027886 [Hyalomma asiaticum]
MAISERWRQRGMFKDFLRVACGDTGTKRGFRRFREWCFIADRTADQVWDAVRPGLRSRRRQPVQDEKVVVLGDERIPDSITDVLNKGPKFATEPSVSAAEEVSVIRMEALLPDQLYQDEPWAQWMEEYRRELHAIRRNLKAIRELKQRLPPAMLLLPPPRCSASGGLVNLQTSIINDVAKEFPMDRESA